MKTCAFACFVCHSFIFLSPEVPEVLEVLEVIEVLEVLEIPDIPELLNPLFERHLRHHVGGLVNALLYFFASHHSNHHGQFGF